MEELDSDAHQEAADAFADAAMNACGAVIDRLLLFGSVAREEARGIDSDVDVYVVLDTEQDAKRDYAAQLRNLAYDITLEHGVVISLHVQITDEFEARKDHPFIKAVLDERRAYT
jgi:predicted nucleotidyltransferase